MFQKHALLATEIDSDKIRKYTEWRSREGQADPTIRRQLVPLRAMLRLAAREKKIFSVPYFSMPEDSDAAGQYIEPSQFAALLTHLPNKLHPFFKFLYHNGLPHRSSQRDYLVNGEPGRQRDPDPGRVDESTEAFNGRVGRKGSRTRSQRIEEDVSAQW
jgi:hypothetical protein